MAATAAEWLDNGFKLEAVGGEVVLMEKTWECCCRLVVAGDEDVGGGGGAVDDGVVGTEERGDVLALVAATSGYEMADVIREDEGVVGVEVDAAPVVRLEFEVDETRFEFELTRSIPFEERSSC